MHARQNKQKNIKEKKCVEETLFPNDRANLKVPPASTNVCTFVESEVQIEVKM